MARPGGRPAVEVEGARELRAAFRRMDGRLDDLTDVNRSAAEVVAGQARTLVPVLSGALLDTIRTSAAKTRSAVLAGQGRVPYAGVIHFGWPARNIEPQPYLYDALDARRDDVAERYRDHVSKLVARFDTEAP